MTYQIAKAASRDLLCVFSAIALLAAPADGQRRTGETVVAINGRVTVLVKNNKVADDVSDAVIWLETEDPVPVQVETVTVNTAKKEFQPHVAVVPVGSYVEFPNSDAFDHNVFSLSEIAFFDLGTFGRGETRGTSFERPGIIRVYCNVHANMSGTIVVRDNPYFAQPLADGSFTIPGVPAGTYTLHAWHERSREAVTRQVEIGADGLDDVTIELDARAYEFVQHLNKFGRPYSTARRGRRY